MSKTATALKTEVRAASVPTDYLDWIVNKSDIKDRDIRATARFYLRRNSSGGT